MLYSIHALRFLAATAVVCHHSGLGEQFGTSIGGGGVDIFFVISGVVIGTSTKPGVPAYDFLRKRFIRIFPLYWTSLAAVIAFKFYFWNGLDTLSDIIHSALLVPPDLSSNWFPLYSPAWTLSYELMFYLAFALCLPLGRYARLACCTLMIASAFMLFNTGSQSYLRLWPMLMLEFVAGVAISFAIQRRFVPNQMLGTILIAAGIAGFTTFAWAPTPPRWLAWGIPAVLLVYGSLAFESAALLRRPLIALGGHASYAIYLFHTTLMSGVGIFFIWCGTRSTEHPWIFAAITIPLSVGLGMAIWLGWDRPALALLSRITCSYALPSQQRAA